MPNLSTVGPTMWPPIENRHTHSHLYYIDVPEDVKIEVVVLVPDKQLGSA